MEVLLCADNLSVLRARPPAPVEGRLVDTRFGATDKGLRYLACLKHPRKD